MALEDTIRQMLQEGKKPAVDKDKVKAELKAAQEQIKKFKKAGKDVTKLTTKVKDLRKQLKESFGEDDVEEVNEAKAEYSVDGANVVDSDGEVIHVADSEEEAQEIVAKLNSELTEAADDEEDEEKEGEEDKEKPAGDEDGEDLFADDEVPAAPASDDVSDLPPLEDEVPAEEGEMPDDERVTVVVVSPEHEDDESGEEEGEEEVKEDTGEADARKTQPSSKEEQEKVFAKHKERMNKLGDEDEVKKESVDVIESLLSGETLSEEFKEKTRVIFEAALNEKLEQHKKLVEDRIKGKYTAKLKTIREEYDQKLSKQISIVEDTIVEKIDAFLNYEVDQWVNENKVALVGNLRAELTEEFIDGLKGLFKEHYIDVPDEKFDLIGAQEETIQTLEAKLEESVKSYSDLAKQNKELKRKMIVAEASEGLTETQKMRFEKLTEKVDFESEKAFLGKLEIIKESYFGKRAEKEALTEETKEEQKPLSTVDLYAKMLKRQ